MRSYSPRSSVQIFITHKTFWILFCLHFGFTTISLGQDPNFRRLGLKDGLSQSSILCILQDSSGFMWFGTEDGLNRYDGYEFKVFRQDSDNPYSLKSNRINGLGIDEKGIIWTSSHSGILHRFTPSTERFEAYFLADYTQEKALSISSLSVADTNTVWIGSDQGLFLFDWKNRNAKIVLPVRIKVLLKGVDNNLFVIGEGNVFYSVIPEAPNVPKQYEVRHNNVSPSILTLLPSHTGGVWVGTTEGLFHFDLAKKEFVKWRNEVINNIIYDSEGKLWLGTSEGGLIWEPFKETTTKFTHSICNPGSISQNHISSIYLDKSRSMWVGTFSGLNYYNKHKVPFKQFVHDNCNYANVRVRSVYVDNSNTLWVGTEENGWFARPLNADAHWNYSQALPNPIKKLPVWAIFEDSQHNLWMGSKNRLLLVSRISNQQIQQSFPTTINDSLQNCPHESLIMDIAEDDQKRLWIATQRCGLYIWNPASDEVLNYKYINEKDSLAIRTIAKDNDGSFWLGTEDKGVINVILNNNDPAQASFRWLSDTLNSTQGLSHPFVNSIYPTDSVLWIATYGGGLNKYHRNRREFTYYNEKDGLPNEVVYVLLPDNQNNIWMSTNKGISRFDPFQKKFTNFDIHDGLQNNEFNSGVGFKNPKSGELFFGGVSGLNSFSPEKIAKLSLEESAPIVFTNFFLADTSVVIGLNSVLKRHINHTPKIILSPNDVSFAFRFATLDYSNPGKNKYKYKLEGFNEEWIEIGTRRYVSFTNLPPGSYNFRVKGTNSMGKWTESEASVRIKIRSPWFWNPFAWAIYGCLIIGLLLGVYIYYRNKSKLRQAEKFNQKQSEFFAGIAHEFRTPLTLILGPAEDLFRSLNDQVHSSQVKNIRTHATRLTNLINQILDIAKIESKTDLPQYLKGELVSYIRGIQELFDGVAKNRQIAFEFSSLEKQIYAEFDPEILTKIVYNLLSNALKHTPVRGKVGIYLKVLSAESSPLKAESIRLSVSDTGSGIPEEELPFVFDRYFTGKKQVEKRGKISTGIGLALCKELVRKLGGQIKANSILGAGSEFIAFLPLRKLDKDMIKDEELIKKAGFKNMFQPDILIDSQVAKLIIDEKGQEDQPLVLLVEDEFDVLSYLTQILHIDYRLHTASNGLEALDKAKELEIDLIVSDILMPVMDGIELCKHIKEDIETSHIPVIMLTAKHGKDARIEGLKIGADDYIEKPFDPEELRIRIQNLLEIRKKIREKYRETLVLESFDVEINSIDKEFVVKLIRTIQENLSDESFHVEELSEKMAVSRPTLYRKTKNLMGKAPSILIKEARLERAHKLLENEKSLSISEVAFTVGFKEVTHFSASFKKHFGLSPSEVKNGS